MIKHIWTVLCRESTINQDDNVISLYGVLEELTIALTPVKGAQQNPTSEKLNIPLNFELVSLWTKDVNEKQAKSDIEIIFLSPTGEELNKIVQELVIPAGIKRFRSRMKISGLTVQGTGEYCFKVRAKDEGKETYKNVSELPLDVKIIKNDGKTN